MKFSTPELYVRGNSDDPDEVDRVEAEWERASQRYRRRLKKIEPSLPPQLRQFLAEQCLHDADVFGPARLPVYSMPANPGDVIIVAQQINTLIPEFINTLAILQYAAVADLVVGVPYPSPVFSKAYPYWLYDEVDLIEPGLFSHEILFSDGRVVKLVFKEFRYHIAPLILPAQVAPVPGQSVNGPASAAKPRKARRRA
jgi:hypothetical protein